MAASFREALRRRIAVLLRPFRKLLLQVRLHTLWLCPPARLYRIGREHHLEPVRRRAWILSKAFVVGEGCNFGWHVSVIGEGVELGNRVSVSPGVMFISAAYPTDGSRLLEIPGFAYRFVRRSPSRIKVDNDTWIGANSIILPGVKIGKSCLVSAGSVVGKDVPDYAIVAGSPAEIVGDVRKWRSWQKPSSSADSAKR